MSPSASASEGSVECHGCTSQDGPTYLTITLSGLTDGVGCDLCDEVNGTYILTLSQSGSTCSYIYEEEAETPTLLLEAWIRDDGVPTEGDCGTYDYYIELWLNKYDEGGNCSMNSHTWWLLCSSTPIDCHNLSQYMSRVYTTPNGCGGGTAFISSS